MDGTRRRSARGGFSLIEAAVATVLIGLGVVALMTTVQSNIQTVDNSATIAQAVLLCGEIREWTMRLPFTDPQTPDNSPGSDEGDPQVALDDLDDLMGVTFSPPRDAHGLAIADMTGWSQAITLTWRDPVDLESILTAGSSNIVHVKVDISYQNSQIFSTGYFMTKER